MNVLADFRNVHAGQSIIVCGLGESLSALANIADRGIMIGVNDIGRKFDPTYLIVMNTPQQFGSERWPYIATTQAKFIFTQLESLRASMRDAERVVVFNLGDDCGADLSADDSLPYTSNSPYVALCLAAFMGASRIGLIGVDFTDHHLTNTETKMTRIDGEYRALSEALGEKGIKIVNLSALSRLTAFPKMRVEEFLCTTQ